MRSRFLFGLLLYLVTLPTQAQDAARRAKVEELFSVLHLERMTEQIVAGVQKQMIASMQTMPGMSQITPEQKQLLQAYQDKVLALVNQSVSWKQLEPEMVMLYANTYSDEELDGILTFYKSPVGQSMLAKTPELTAKGLQITQTRMVALQPQINDLMQEFVRKFSAAAQPANGTVHGGAATPHP